MDPNSPLTVRLYVRADASVVKRRNDLVARLKRLDRQHRIDSVHIQLWPRAVSLDLLDVSDDTELREVVRAFEAWAERQDRHVEPPFEVRTTRSTITGASDDQLVLPMLCIATYRDGLLVDVAPCGDGDAARTVEDVIDALAAGEQPGTETRSDSEPVPQ
ncbi:HTH domain-containing protein [Haloplanus aerogenes]|uniref:Uncharacterized protein n=1 Tax=Haloplanus aerogenes TaxID=660522 RepID=A0A3M0CIV1_9EURY|nr:HTH domain-containing protein [Haloplanus aerogenes]AZH24809.1 hypothetical protein DU502_05205 [Haloplanus aerogenes]RMB08350.1 hypothetical protein ATH50_3567 [Haloplanus aerogenes]